MRIKLKRYNSMDGMEFAYLREFDVGKMDKIKLDVLNRMNFYERNNNGIVISKKEDYTIFYDGRFYIAEEALSLEEGQLLFMNFVCNENKYMLYNINTIPDDVIELADMNLSKIRLSGLRGDITKENILGKLKEMKEIDDNIYKKREEEEEQKALEYIKQWKEWKDEGKYKSVYKGLKIDNDKIIKEESSWNCKEFTLKIDKKFSDIMDYDKIESECSNYSNIPVFIEVLHHKGVKKFNLVTDGKEFNIVYGEKETKINDVKVKKSAVPMIIRNVKKDFTKDNIKLINGLGVTRLNLLAIEKLRVGGDIDVPVEVTAVNKDLYKVQIGNDIAEMGWSKAKDLFSIGVNTIKEKYLPYHSFLNFMKTFLDKEKTEILEMLRNYKTLEDL